MNGTRFCGLALTLVLALSLLLGLSTCEKDAGEGGGGIVSVAIDPATATVERGESAEFTALVNGTPSSAVSWSIVTSGKAAGTTISSAGKLKVSASEKLSAFVVKAVSQADASVSGQARVKVTGELTGVVTVTKVTITPVNPDVAKGSTRTFTATVEGTNNPSQEVTWSLVASGKKSGTTIDSTGTLTIAATEALKTLKVVATSVEDTSKSGTTTVTIAPSSGTVQGVTVSPSQAEVMRGGTARFSATVEGTGEPAQTVIWDIIESDKHMDTTVDASGVLSVSIDEVRNTITLRAASVLDTSIYGTAQVTLRTPDPAVVTRVTVSPDNAEVVRGGTTTFSATVEGTGNPERTVIWDIVESGKKDATTITDGKLVVAVDETLPSLTVRARSTYDSSKSGTATVTVTILGPVNHVVTFDSAGGSFVANGGQSELVVYVEDGKLLNRPEDPVRAGYRVSGWFVGDMAWDFDVHTVTADITLRAQWIEAYLVTFESSGGTAIDSQTVSKGGLVTRPADPTLAHYIFGGWYKEEALSTAWNFASDTVRAATTLWAKWTPESFTVTFDANGGSQVSPANKTVYYGQAYGALATAARAGYDLSGWYTAKEGGMLVNEETQVALSGNQTLWAHWQTAVYTVLFDSSGGSDVPEQAVMHGRTLSRPADPVKEGYTFAGWYKEAALVNAWNFSTDTVTGALTLYAKWTQRCTVTFNANEGYPTPASQIVDAGGKVTQPSPAPTRSGYTFAGWYRDAALASVWNFDTDTVSANLTLYAKWTISSYTVTFESSGGSAVAAQNVAAGGKVTRPANPTWAGYVFSGWYRDAGLSSAWNFDSDTVTENVTLWAKWTISSYTVTFESSGGSAVAAQNVAAGGKVTRPANPTRAGYVFSGWYRDAGLSSAWNFDNDTVTENVTLWAKWTIIASGNYIVTFESSGGTAIDTQVVAAGGTASRPPNPTRDGYVFVDWYKEAALVNAWNFAVDLVTGNITLWAKWTPNKYNLIYNANGGTLVGGTGAGSISYGATVTLPASGSKDGSALSGFILTGALSGPKAPGDTFVMPAGDVTATAAWTANTYTLSYNDNGGALSGGTGAGSISYGATVTLPTSGSRTGYSLSGFTLSGAASGTKAPGETFVMPAGAVTATANWTLNSYALSYESNDGTLYGGTPAGSVLYGTAVTLPTSGSKTGYTLSSFTLSGAASGTKASGETFLMPAGAVMVTANWTVNTYTLTYNTGGGTLTGGTAAGSISYGALVTLPTFGTKSDQALNNFVLSGALTGTKNPGAVFTMPAGAVIVTATWTAGYTLSYNAAGGTLSGGTPAGSVAPGALVTLPASGTKTGYTLTGFILGGAASGTKTPGSTFLMPSGSVAATATWTAVSYTLRYDSGGGTLTGGTAAGSVGYGLTVTLPTSGTRTGYTLTGFTLSGAESGTKTPGSTFTMPLGDVTATANWTGKNYTLSYSAAGGELSGGTPAGSIACGDPVTLPPSGVKAGYTLSGFVLSGSASGTLAPGETFAMPAGAVRATAIWAPALYFLSYETGGGTLSGGTPDGEVGYGTTVTLPASGEKGTALMLSDFTLSGGMTGTKAPGATFVMPAEDVTVTANWITATYTLTYVAGGGTLSGGTAAGSVPCGSLVRLPTSGVKEGNTLMGFTLSGAMNVEKSAGTTFTMPEGAVTVTAIWTANTYTLTYANGGTFTDGTEAGSIPYGSLVTLPSSGTKSGYILTGFIMGGALSGAMSPGETFPMPAGNVTATSSWSQEIYILLVYNANGGTLYGGTAEGTFAPGTLITLPSAATKTGYTFRNFTLSGTLSGTKNPGETFVMPEGPVTVTANWTANLYTLTYDVAGGVLSGGTAAGNVAYGSTVRLPTGNWTGHTLTDFTMGGKLSGTRPPGSTFTMPEGDVTAKANWTVTTYALTYITNGGTLTGGTAAGNIAYNSTVTLPTSAVRAGYNFCDFTLSGAVSGTETTGAAFKMPLGEVTVTANWEPITYNVTYNGNGATGGSTASSSHTYDVAKTLTPNGFTRTDYFFIGWSTSASGSMLYTDRQSVKNLTRTQDGNVTLYAKWKSTKYTVTFDSNGGGTPSESSKIVTYQEAYGSLPSVGRAGYNFLGWYTEAEEGTKVWTDTIVTRAENHTLYAHWAEKL